MYRNLIAFIMCLLVATAVFAVDGEVSWEKKAGEWIATEQMTIDLGSGANLDVDRFRGDIRISGEDRDNIQLTLVYRGGRKLNEAEAKEAFEEYRPEIKLDGNTLNVEGVRKRNWINSKNGWFEMIATIPSHFDMSAETAGGDIDLINVTGQCELDASGGDIEISNTQGQTTLSTAGGDIHVAHHNSNLDLDDKDGLISASASGGDIEFHDVKGRLAIATAGGDILLEKVDAQRIKAESSGGNVELIDAIFNERSSINVAGGDIRTDNSSGDLELSVSGGDVDVENHIGSMIAEGNGGDISISNIAGDLDVNVNGGDLFAQYSKSATQVFLWDLAVNSGDATLNIPEAAEVSLDARIRYSDDKDDIQSDFPLTKREKGMTVTAHGDVNGGGTDIHVTVGGGEIRIEKI
jgi:DUF4097 and DUF4098 domain-containing protein YvlB